MKSSSSSSPRHLQVIFIFMSSSFLDLDHHHWIYIITQYGSSLDIITGSRSSLDQYHHCWIITGSRSLLDLDQYHGCYLMILLVTWSSTEPALFHAGCRPSHHVGLFPALTSHLLVKKACLALTYDHIGTNPIITSERPSTHIHQHDRTSHH